MPDIYLYSGATNPNDIILRDPTVLDSGVTVAGDGGSGAGYREALSRYEADRFERQLEARRTRLEEHRQEQRRQERQVEVQRLDEIIDYLKRPPEQTYEQIDAGIFRLVEALNDNAAQVAIEKQIQDISREIAARMDDEDALTVILMAL